MADKKQTLQGGWPNYRSPHRRRAHAEAHAGAGAAPPPVIEHDLVPADAPRTIETQGALLELIGQLRDAGSFGYDTEFIGEETFYPRFCVIQVATVERVSLIDVLAEIDLTPFWELLADPAVEVIVHAGQQDLEPVQRITGRPPGRVFDTQIAAAFTGRMYPLSLTKLCLDAAGADLGTSSKFSQWDRRPLTDLQKGYAANDVRYLLLLRKRIGEELSERGHIDKVVAESESFADPATYRADPLKMKLKAKGVGKLGREQLAVLNALLLWRAGAAEQRDIPMRVLLDDQSLMDLASDPVEKADDVKKLKGIPWPVKQDCSDELVKVTAEALAGPLPVRAPRFKPLSDHAKQLLDAVWNHAQSVCEEVGVAPSIAFTKRDITALVRAAVAHKPRPTLRITQGWRGELLAPVFDKLDGEAASSDQ